MPRSSTPTGSSPASRPTRKTGDVLMVAHMNAEALRRTIESGEAWYFSRSRKSLWRKGESSGHVQRVVEMRVDCDQDAVWIKVEQGGPGACHTGRRSCFYRAVQLGKAGAATLEFRDADKAFDPKAVYATNSPSFDGFAGAREHLFGARKMRPVVHHAVDGDRARAGRCGERRDDRARLRQRFGGRREHLVDDRHLRRMDREPPDEAVAARFLGVAPQPVEIAEVGIDRLDRRRLGGGGAEQAERRAQADRAR